MTVFVMVVLFDAYFISGEGAEKKKKKKKYDKIDKSQQQQTKKSSPIKAHNDNRKRSAIIPEGFCENPYLSLSVSLETNRNES